MSALPCGPDSIGTGGHCGCAQWPSSLPLPPRLTGRRAAGFRPNQRVRHRRHCRRCRSQRPCRHRHRGVQHRDPQSRPSWQPATRLRHARTSRARKCRSPSGSRPASGPSATGGCRASTASAAVADPAGATARSAPAVCHFRSAQSAGDRSSPPWQPPLRRRHGNHRKQWEREQPPARRTGLRERPMHLDRSRPSRSPDTQAKPTGSRAPTPRECVN
jgi:hypothetical protein